MVKLKSGQIIRFYVGERDLDNKDVKKRDVSDCAVDKALGRKLGMKVSTSCRSGRILYKNDKIYKTFTLPERTYRLVLHYDTNLQVKPGHYKVVID